MMLKLKTVICLLTTIIGLQLMAAENKTLMFPADFQKGEFALAEEFPGVLYFCLGGTWKKATLSIDLPNGIDVSGASYLWNASWKDGKRTNVWDDMKAVPVPGARRFTITLSPLQLTQARSGLVTYQLNRIYLTAAKGMAGKNFQATWTVSGDGKTLRQDVLKLSVIPPLRMPPRPAAHFVTLISFLYSFDGAPTQDLKNKLADFWTGLSSQEVITDNFMKMPTLPGYAFDVSLPSIDQMPAFRPNAFETAIRKGQMLDKYPHNPKRFGMHSVCLAYLAQDPQGDFQRYYEQGVQDMKAANPHAKYVFWNYEPGVHASCPYDWEQFAKHLKLDRKLTKKDIDRDYYSQWKAWRFDQTTTVVRKVSEAFRKHWPDARLMLCGANVYPPSPDLRDPYCATDPRMYDQWVDYHVPMSYYGGTTFFDHSLATVKNTRKPVYILIDPAEMSRIFYERYPDWSIRQSIIAAAAMGAKGIGFYPYDSYDARRLQAIADGFTAVSAADDLFHQGKDITATCSMAPANVIEVELSDAEGRTTQVKLPELQTKLRYRVHQLDNRFAVTLINYDEKQEVFFRITVPGFCQNALFKLPAKGADIFMTVPEQTALQQELNQAVGRLKKKTNLKRLVKDGTVTEWRALNQKLHFTMISSKYGKVMSMFDPTTAALRAWRTPSGIDLMRYRTERGFLGRISFLDGEKMVEPDDFQPLSNDIQNGRGQVTFKTRIKGYEDAQAERYPFEGLEINSTFDQSTDGYQIWQTIVLRNNSPLKQPMTTALRVQTFPRLGWSMAHANFPLTQIGSVRIGDNIVNSGRSIPFYVKPGNLCPWGALKGTPGVWNSKDLSMIAKHNKRLEQIRLEPDQAFTTAYSWWDDGHSYTAEVITNPFTLSYGAEKRFRIIYTMIVR